jgi:taurine dioxygenase
MTNRGDPLPNLEVHPLSGALGAEIQGVDLAGPLPDALIAKLEDALVEHQVIFFRDQRLSLEGLQALGRRFGPLQVHPFHPSVEGHPEVLLLEPGQARPAVADGDAWHSDLTGLAAPPLGSILYGAEVPDVGGDTIFASGYAAYEALSKPLQRMLGELRAVHDMMRVFGPGLLAQPDGAQRWARARATYPPALHPIVRTHPVSGRKSLFVNPIFTERIDGIPGRESAALLAYLYEHTRLPEFQCRFRWRAGSVAFWDNRCTQHYPVADYWPRQRRMHRVAIEGDVPA